MKINKPFKSHLVPSIFTETCFNCGGTMESKDAKHFVCRNCGAKEIYEVLK